MNTRVCLTITLILATFFLGVDVDARDGQITPSLSVMLDQVPLEVASIESGWATVRYVDYEALFQSEGLSLFRAFGSVDLLTNAVPLGVVLSRIASGPEALKYVITGAGRMVDVVGFEWLLDVDCSLEFGDPPNVGLLLGGTFDYVAIGAALQDRGFRLVKIDGADVWHRFDDNAVSLKSRDPVDPFGGYIGAAARIALLPDSLANARGWPLLEAIVSTAQATHPSLADSPEYCALAEAISEPSGLLIQALFFSGAAFEFAGSMTQTEDPDLFPPFSAIALADRQEGEDQVHLIGIVCADMASARSASSILARRVQEFYPPGRPEDVLADRYGAEISVRDVRHSQDGAAIAVIEARYPLPDKRVDPQTGVYNTRGLLYRSWVQAIMRREFKPLWR